MISLKQDQETTRSFCTSNEVQLLGSLSIFAFMICLSSEVNDFLLEGIVYSHESEDVAYNDSIVSFEVGKHRSV
eukprot:snap_masked-scaffold_4-processed-gene-7.33-mRNA-1 protein AED:1.00 eAED:1.00 QI:0/0/0/0/1/1/4/0/73